MVLGGIMGSKTGAHSGFRTENKRSLYRLFQVSMRITKIRSPAIWKPTATCPDTLLKTAKRRRILMP